MALLEFSRVEFGYSDERIITEATGALQRGEIVGLVGANGCGKTTLLSILLGSLQPEEGTVQRARDAQIAYVPQAAQGEDGAPLYDFVRAGRKDLMGAEQELAALRAELAAGADNPGLATRLSRLEERFSALDGHRWDAEVERLLGGLYFAQEDFARPLRELSGGQRQKACLARALISNSNCMIFDEPTNHLDLAAQGFLVSYIKQLPQDTAVLLVSHDRWLLDALCTQIWEVDGTELFTYKGRYSDYVPRRELRREQQRKEFERQQEHIARTEDYIRRNIAGQNTKQAQGRRKILARMERIDAPARDPQVSFILTPEIRTGEQLLMVEDLTFGYGAESGGTGDGQAETHVRAGHSGLTLNPPLSVANSTVGQGLVVDRASFTLYRGERLGIVGPNGCGKSTLLRLLARQLPAQRGMAAWGSNAELGIFSQDSADLHPDSDPVGEVRRVESGISDSEARDYLARFGFSGDDAFKQVRQLSGGEKSRLSLAKIFRRRPNVLLLDEPTNHLDIYAREALEQFLEAYGGSVVLVTHDRALLERICNRLFVFGRDDKGQPTCTFFRGSYLDYLDFVAGKADGQAEAQPSSGNGNEVVARRDNPVDHSAAELEQLAREARCSVEAYCVKQEERERRRAASIEQRLAEIEDEAAALTTQQSKADAAGDYTKLASLQEQIDTLKAEEEEQVAMLVEVEELAAAWHKRAAATAG